MLWRGEGYLILMPFGLNKSQPRTTRPVNCMKINITNKQYLALLKVVYLGNWMANAQRDGSPEDKRIEEYENISDFVFSLAPQFGFEKYMSHEVSDGDRYFPTMIFEEETDVHELHEEYNENAFWDDLCEKLGERDFRKKYSQKEIQNMSDDERFAKLYECIDAWDEELVKNGIERLEIRKDHK